MSVWTDQDLKLPETITKRDGSVVPFDLERVQHAVEMCYSSLDHPPVTPIADIVEGVANAIAVRYSGGAEPHVEEIQDTVETTLLVNGEFQAARHYIVYREKHAAERAVVPAEVRAAFAESAEYFPTLVQQFMFFDKYSRYDHEKKRRETWRETVDRSVNHLRYLSEEMLPASTYLEIHNHILRMDAMPSMRLLAQAGPAAERNGTAIYNCSFLPVKDIRSFTEMMLISMAGCGVGFSVERHNVEQFDRIQRQTGFQRPTFVVEDTTEGWSRALDYGIRTWWAGDDVDFDVSNVRPAGSVLFTKGGRASGPGPLTFVLDFCRTMILSRQGTFLRTIDAHDMACAVGGAAVSGGVRRTAMISLFDWDDIEMRTCKDGLKLDQNPVRWNANNSAVWPDQITQIELVDQMTEMYRNARGEPGIFSRANALSLLPERRKAADFGTNPCGEINLRPYQFCNLSIAVARPDDTLEALKRKVEIATIVGTIQSMATNFPGLRDEWRRNCEEERLLGVDITGQRDCKLLLDPEAHGTSREEVFEELKRVAIETNAAIARRLGINPSAAISCNKPSGNSSQLLDTSSGIHARWAPFYVRNMRVSANTPIFRVLKAAGVPMDPENGQMPDSATSWVAHFPVKAPEGALCRKDVSAIDQCNYWLDNRLHWTEHNPSVTITYEPEELIDVMDWVWTHRGQIGGMAFLPADDAQYDQMPYEEITEEEYERRIAEFPDIDFSLIAAYEEEDMTTAAQEIACSSGACEVQF